MLQALENLSSIENHAKASFYMTKDIKYLELNNLIRNMRSKYLNRLIKKEAQLWCISKHICLAKSALEECGNRYYSKGEKDLAIESYNDAGKLL